MTLTAWTETIHRCGWAVIENVFPRPTVDRLCSELESSLRGAEGEGESIRSRGGGVYAARNMLSLFPHAAQIWRTAPLPDVLQAVLGEKVALVRVLFFDKPPRRSWSLPWHKDLTIAVADNRMPSKLFTKPTNKAGAPHVEAPETVLQSMLTLRIHLDDATDDNGPLKVITGSHHDGKSSHPPPSNQPTRPVDTIYARRGDVLAMRPLLTHSSGNATPGTILHRRILHLEFTGMIELPDGYRWHQLVR